MANKQKQGNSILAAPAAQLLRAAILSDFVRDGLLPWAVWLEPRLHRAQIVVRTFPDVRLAARVEEDDLGQVLRIGVEGDLGRRALARALLGAARTLLAADGVHHAR